MVNRCRCCFTIVLLLSVCVMGGCDKSTAARNADQTAYEEIGLAFVDEKNNEIYCIGDTLEDLRKKTKHKLVEHNDTEMSFHGLEFKIMDQKVESMMLYASENQDAYWRTVSGFTLLSSPEKMKEAYGQPLGTGYGQDSYYIYVFQKQDGGFTRMSSFEEAEAAPQADLYHLHILFDSDQMPFGIVMFSNKAKTD